MCSEIHDRPPRAAALRVLSAIAVGLLLAPALWAATFPDKPPDSAFHVDEAELLDADSAAEIDAIASKLLTDMQVPLYVVTIDSLLAQEAAALTIEQYTQQLFDHWGIGWQDRNVGMLLVVSRADRKARIEFGADFDHRYDNDANEIMQTLIVPAFKRGDYNTGLLDGVRGLDRIGRGLDLPRPTPPWWFWPALIAGAIGLVALIVNLFRTGRSGWAWALIAAIAVLLFMLLRNAGKSSGSSGGFGGGSSGGGGASGSW